MKQNALNWFDIYVADFGRSKKFYETILDIEMEETNMEGAQMAIFPYTEEDGVGGCLAKMECGQPGPGGTIVYLNVEGQLDAVIARIPEAGGKILKERMAIPPHGFIAIFEDSEGNMIGLHSMS